VDRVLPYHQSGFGQLRLLGFSVDQVVGVQRVQVAHLGARDAGGAAHQRAVDARMRLLRMSDQDDDLGHAGKRLGLPGAGAPRSAATITRTLQSWSRACP
jgi:hypothetical protein